jgi:anti-anti-sigma factor
MLIVLTERSGDVVTVRCRGRLVAGSQAWDLYNSVISQDKAQAVVLDLAGVKRMDASGLGVLVVLSQWAESLALKLRLIPSRPVKELLELTKLESLFEMVPLETPSEAGLFDPGRGESAEERCA